MAPLGEVEIWAGDWKTSQRLLNGLNEGALGLVSVFASDIVGARRRLADWRCSLRVLRALPADVFEGRHASEQSAAGITPEAANRFFTRVLQRGKDKWGNSTARLPWGQEEVKAHLTKRHCEGARKAKGIVASEGPGACTLHKELGLTRPLTKATLKCLDPWRAANFRVSRAFRARLRALRPPPKSATRLLDKGSPLFE